MNKGLNRAIRVWMFLGFAFLYIPILVIILMSFNGTPYAALREPFRQVGAVLETAFHPARSGRNHLRALVNQAIVD